MRKIAGIPLILLAAIVIGAGIAVASFTYSYIVKPTVEQPTSESTTESFHVKAGDPFTKTKWLELALPANYNLEYKLTGDDDDYLKNEWAKVWLDVNNDGIVQEGEPKKKIEGIGNTVTFSNVRKGQLNQKIVISATARDKVLVTTKWADKEQDPSISTAETSLEVSMVPTAVVQPRT